jgi:hypothetical protein
MAAAESEGQGGESQDESGWSSHVPDVRSIPEVEHGLNEG